MFYYVHAAAARRRPAPTFSVPSGNFGNLTAGLLAWRLGAPIAGFVAATTINDTVPRYLDDRPLRTARVACRRWPTRWTSAIRATSSGCAGCLTTTSRRCERWWRPRCTPMRRCARRSASSGRAMGTLRSAHRDWLSRDASSIDERPKASFSPRPIPPSSASRGTDRRTADPAAASAGGGACQAAASRTNRAGVVGADAAALRARLAPQEDEHEEGEEHEEHAEDRRDEGPALGREAAELSSCRRCLSHRSGHSSVGHRFDRQARLRRARRSSVPDLSTGSRKPAIFLRGLRALRSVVSTLLRAAHSEKCCRDLGSPSLARAEGPARGTSARRRGRSRSAERRRRCGTRAGGDEEAVHRSVFRVVAVVAPEHPSRVRVASVPAS